VPFKNGIGNCNSRNNWNSDKFSTAVNWYIIALVMCQRQMVMVVVRLLFKDHKTIHVIQESNPNIYFNLTLGLDCSQAGCTAAKGTRRGRITISNGVIIVPGRSTERG
jgi:hypothetical protein